MRNWTRWSVAFAASAVLTAINGGALAQNLEGDWRGPITLPNGSAAQMNFAFKPKAGGGYVGWQGPKSEIPLGEVKVDKGTLSFSNGQGGSYSGRWDEARKAWVGNWTTPAVAFPLTLTAGKP